MTAPTNKWRIRPLEPSDRAFILSLIPRLSTFGLPLERDPRTLHALMLEELRNLPSELETALELIAEDKHGQPLGFIQCEAEHDPFSGVARAYVQMLAVEEAAEGQGVGRALLERAMLWARERGLEGLSLHVFATNARARAFYAKMGFIEDTVRLIKPG